MNMAENYRYSMTIVFAYLMVVIIVVMLPFNRVNHFIGLFEKYVIWVNVLEVISGCDRRPFIHIHTPWGDSRIIHISEI
jgi:hypothetical protein